MMRSALLSRTPGHSSAALLFFAVSPRSIVEMCEIERFALAKNLAELGASSLVS